MPGRTARFPADLCPAGASPRRGAVRVLLFGLAILLGAATRVRAQDPAPAETNGTSFVWQGGGLQITDDPAGGRIVTMSSSVVATHGKLKVFADNLVVWIREGATDLPGNPNFQLREFYAEGHLRMENGKQILEGERAYVNLESGTLLVEKAKLHTQSKRRGIPISLSAAELRRIGQGDTVGHEVSVSTCEFEVPDYHIVSKEVQIHGEWKSGDIDVYGVTLHINPLDFPIFYTPYLPVTFGSQVPLRKLRYAKTRNFGPSIFSKFGIDIPATHRDGEGKPLLDEDGDPQTDIWGTVGFDLDYMKRRGLGFGPEYDYQWDKYRGFGDVYYLHDAGDVPPSSFADRLFPIPKKDRGRGRFFHRQEIWGDLSADLELHYVSDRNFREEFLEKEFKEDKAPETYVLLRYMYDNFGMTGLYRPRINTFQDYVEYLPQVTQSLVDQGLPLGLYVSHNAQWANVRLRRDFAESDV
ncbi:MAG: hypothetical protein K8T20_07955, partial [Planctomycetes bacterium]|nr:hypothetical protein [Planctomycetota bacterium]